MIGRALLLALLLAPLLAAQEDPCPITFPPEACDVGGIGVTPTAPPPILPNCDPCFTVGDMEAAMAGAGAVNRNCQVSTGGGTQFALLATSVNGPPPQVTGIYTTGAAGVGSCSRDDINSGGPITAPAGTLDAADLLECAETLEYWVGGTIATPNQVCENVT